MHDDQKKLSADRYPGYDVLSKRNTPSWNEQTRAVIAQRLAIGPEPKFFAADEFVTLEAIANRLVPQPASRPHIPVAALVDHKLHSGKHDGYRQPGMPREKEAWRLGLAALNAEANDAHGNAFQSISEPEQDALLKRMQNGEMKNSAWNGMPPATFFKQRMAHDIVHAYYAHPIAWSEIGWGGPASPRGYVRMDFNERDSWEAAEVKGGDVSGAKRKNSHVG